MNQKLFLILIASFVFFSGVASASLVDRGNGMIYDTRLNVTWLQDTNYAFTSGYASANEGVVNDFYGQRRSKIILNDGRMDFNSANQWAELKYGGYDDWRLPTYQGDTSSYHGKIYSSYELYPSNPYYSTANALISRNGLDPSVFLYDNLESQVWYGVPDLQNEMAFMYYDNLGNLPGIGGTEFYKPGPGEGFIRKVIFCTTNCLSNTGSFINLKPESYWTNLTEKGVFGVDDNTGGGKHFDFSYGETNTTDESELKLAWAVRSGDVAVIPIPSAFILLISGLIGLLRFKK